MKWRQKDKERKKGRKKKGSKVERKKTNQEETESIKYSSGLRCQSSSNLVYIEGRLKCK